MGNVVSTLVTEWPGVLPPTFFPSLSLLQWVMRWAVFASKLAWRSAMWGSGMTTVHLPPLPSWAADVVGRHPTAAALRVVARLTAFLVSVIRHVISPDLVMRQLCAVAVLQTGYELYRYMRSRRRARELGNHRQLLVEEMANARDFVSWKLAASQLDVLEGLDKWRYDNRSPFYDAEQVELKLRHIQYLVRKGDVASLRWHLRGELLRKHLGLTNPQLFTKSHVGTKRLVEEYTEAVAAALDFLCDVGAETDTADSIVEKLAFFNETRHAFGRSAFLFSGGGMMGLYHMGVIKALVEKQLLPRVISGASAGSIAAALLGCHTDEELLHLLNTGGVDLNFFGVRGREASAAPQEPDNAASGGIPDGWWHKLVLLLPEPLKSLAVEARRAVPRWVKERTLLDIEVLGDCLRRNVGDLTFAEAYEHTGRIINITVTPHNSTDYPSLLNYLTAPHVLVWSAALASCAIPGVFAPVELIAKDKHGVLRPYLPGGLRWSDGSVECDLPMARLSELFNVNVFIVSQVNPHASLFAATGLGAGPVAKLIQYLKRSIKSFIQNVSDLGLATFLRPLWRGLLPLVTQKYEGDCTIVPAWTIDDVRKLLANPNNERLQHAILRGMQSTWPKISWIRTHCLVEFTLDECVSRLRDRMEALAVQEQADAAAGRAGGHHAAKLRFQQQQNQRGSGYWRRQSAAIGRLPSFSTSRSVVALADMAAGLTTRTASRDSLGSAGANEWVAAGAAVAAATAQGGSSGTGRDAASAPPLQRRDSWRAPLGDSAAGEWVGGGSGDHGGPDVVSGGDERASPDRRPGSGGGMGLRLGSIARLNILDEQAVERAYMAAAAQSQAGVASPPELAVALAAARRRSASLQPSQRRVPTRVRGQHDDTPERPATDTAHRERATAWARRGFSDSSSLHHLSSDGNGASSVGSDRYPSAVGLPSDADSIDSPPAWWYSPSAVPRPAMRGSTGLDADASATAALNASRGSAGGRGGGVARGTSSAVTGAVLSDVQAKELLRHAIGAGAIKGSDLYLARTPVASPTSDGGDSDFESKALGDHEPSTDAGVLLLPGRSLSPHSHAAAVRAHTRLTSPGSDSSYGRGDGGRLSRGSAGDAAGGAVLMDEALDDTNRASDANKGALPPHAVVSSAAAASSATGVSTRHRDSQPAGRRRQQRRSRARGHGSSSRGATTVAGSTTIVEEADER